MFYCEPCRKVNDWPGILTSSYGKCENCGVNSACYNTSTSALPVRKPVVIVEKNWDGNTEPARKYDRIDDFLALFTIEEKKSWEGKNGKIPNWIVLGVA